MKGKIKFRDSESGNPSGTVKIKRQQEERSACRDFRKSWRKQASDAEDELSDTDPEPMYFDSINQEEESEND